jgi:DNA-binding MarR family transcriptional regulator
VDFLSPYKDDADASTGLAFMRVYNKWHTALRARLRTLGLTHPQFVVMTALNFLSQSDEHVSQTRIARLADLDAMTASQILRGLEARGYVARTSNPRDVRAKAVRLLPAGQELVRRALPVVEGFDRAFFGALKKDEPAFLALLLRLL